MRVLFTFSGGRGHLDPLVPLARAVTAAGHDVALCGRPWMAGQVEALGFRAFSAGPDEGLEPVTRPLLPVDMERERRDLRDGFARRLARARASQLVPILEAWRPDVVVWDETDLGAGIAAERLGFPHVRFVVIAAGGFLTAELLAPAVDEVRAEHGLPPDPELRMLERHLVVSPVPASFRDPSDPLPASTVHVRPFEPTAPSSAGTKPDWAIALPGAPAAWFTLGTVFNHESGDLFPRVLAGLRELELNVLVTVGREIDPATLGPQPPTVRIERFVPRAEVLPFVDLVVSHGGSGSVLGALAHGRPMVLFPMGADQPLNAARCEALGVARSLDVISATPADVARAVTAVLTEPSFRAAAASLRDEIAILPPPDAAIPRLAALAAPTG